MALRVLSAVAAVWILAVVLFAAAMRWTGPGRHPPRPPTTLEELARTLNAAEPDDRRWRWSVTRAQASQGALVVEAQVIDLAEAIASARAIVEPVRSQYTEVLVYVRQAGAPGRFAVAPGAMDRWRRIRRDSPSRRAVTSSEACASDRRAWRLRPRWAVSFGPAPRGGGNLTHLVRG